MIKDLPLRLKELRTSRGYSQRDVAKKLHLSPSIVSGYETGERTPSTDVILSLSYLYNCSTDYLLGKTKECDTFVDIEGLTQEQRIAIVNLIETMRTK